MASFAARHGNHVGDAVTFDTCPLPATLKLSSCPLGINSSIIQPSTVALAAALCPSLEWRQRIQVSSYCGPDLITESVNVIRRAPVDVRHLQHSGKVIRVHRTEVSESLYIYIVPKSLKESGAQGTLEGGSLGGRVS